MSDDDYVEQTRRPTDKFFNDGVRVPHSENKKPYKIDDYGEMEYVAFPPWGFDWEWPRFPDTPIYDGPGTDPADNPYTGDDDDRPPDEWLPFLGCVFSKPFTPASIDPGETSTAELQPRDDKIVAAIMTGPCALIVSPVGCIATAPFSTQRATCTAVIRANDSIEGYQADPESGTVDCVLVLQTASGSSCSARATVSACDPENAVTWDSVNSATSIDQSQSVSVFVENGTAPYTWSVSGSGFTMGSTKTTGMSNTLIADSEACGNATITATDACGTSCTGNVQGTEGEWAANFTTPFGECECSGPPDDGTVYSGTIYCNGWKIYEEKSWVFRCSLFVSMNACDCGDCRDQWTPCITGYTCPDTSGSGCQVTENTPYCCDCTYGDPPIIVVHCLNKMYQYKFEWIC